MNDQKRRRTFIKAAALMGTLGLLGPGLMSMSTERFPTAYYVIFAAALVFALLFISVLIFGRQSKL